MNDERLQEDDFSEFNRYHVGFHATPGPAEQEIRYMLHVVAYDICCPNRLRKVAKICEIYGVRIEKSVFECDLPAVRFDDMWTDIAETIKRDEDAVIAYRICRSCIQEVQSMGQVERPKDRTFYFV